MFFFQVLLLLGYVYADLTSRWLSPRGQAILHTIVAMVAVLTLPIEPSDSWRPSGQLSDPTWSLLGLLATTVGAPFFLLSTTAPLLQVWWHRVFGQAPYRLYAWSNAGSFLALLTFPFVVEPWIGVRMQMLTWSFAFFATACALAYCGFASSRRNHGVVQDNDATERRVPTRRVFAWILLSAIGSILLLAMTSHLTQNVAVVPFLWVAPLALYLLSFVLCFAKRTYYHRWFFGGLMIATHIIAASLYHINRVDNLSFLLAVYLLALFAGCMVCHGELSRLKPPSANLTFYFVMLSVGGALGGFLVSYVAPLVFTDYYEYPLVLVACWATLLFAWFTDESSYLHRGKPAWAWLLIAVACFVFLSQLRDGVVRSVNETFLSRRSFYGVLSIRAGEVDGRQDMRLYHGIINHGSQNLDEELAEEPTAYYRRDGGLGAAMKLVSEKGSKRVGMLGLGIGTAAAYASEGDYFRAYEINQDVIELALNADIFTFWSLLEKRGATGEVIPGDARISLEDELRQGETQAFDILVVDVFSGDAIPVHLLTVEAFEIYRKHLSTHGLLAIHISNRHLDLLPVVQSMADHFSMTAGVIDVPESRWVILGSKPALQLLAQQEPDKLRRMPTRRRRQLWTDDYSDILSVLH